MNTPPPPELHGVTTLFGPLRLLWLSASFIPVTILNLCTSRQFSKLTTWQGFQHAWFGTFWTWFGPLSREHGEGSVRPLLKQAEGIVIDIGPGSGEWLHLFADNKDVTRILGVEPNHEHHPALRRRVQELGLQHVYEILGVGAEDLDKCGIDEGSVDTICTIQCLCSVPEPEKIIKDLYPYLRRGGKWLVYEHVKTKFQNSFVGVWQSEQEAEPPNHHCCHEDTRLPTSCVQDI